MISFEFWDVHPVANKSDLKHIVCSFSTQNFCNGWVGFSFTYVYRLNIFKNTGRIKN